MNRIAAELAYAEALQPIAGMATMKTQLERILRGQDTVGWSRREESGRLDRRAFTRFATGSSAVFSRREMHEAETSALSIMIDCSGSMDGRKIFEARSVAIRIADIAHRARAACAVTGYAMRPTGTEDASFESHRINDELAESYRPTFIEFKRWNEALPRARAMLGAMIEQAKGGTPDYASLYYGLLDVAQRPESRRLLCVITDADGYVPDHMQHLQRMADSLGVVIVAIGLRARHIENCFRHAVNLMSADELGQAAVSTMLRAIR